MQWTLKIDRAKTHLLELQTEIKSFMDSRPYRISTKRDSETKRLIYYVSAVKEPPQVLSLIAGDIIQNLRSAMDHLAYELFISNGGNETEGRNIYFPIEKDFTTYESEKERKTKGMSKDAQDLIDLVKPYQGGNTILWHIHDLNITDKHRSLLLLAMRSEFNSVDIGPHLRESMRKLMPDSADMPSFSLNIKPADNLLPLKIGDELFIDEPDAKELPDMQFRIDVNIVFNDLVITGGTTLLSTLASMIQEVEKLIPIFEKPLNQL